MYYLAFSKTDSKLYLLDSEYSDIKSWPVEENDSFDFPQGKIYPSKLIVQDDSDLKDIWFGFRILFEESRDILSLVWITPEESGAAKKVGNCIITSLANIDDIISTVLDLGQLAILELYIIDGSYTPHVVAAIEAGTDGDIGEPVEADEDLPDQYEELIGEEKAEPLGYVTKVLDISETIELIQ